MEMINANEILSGKHEGEISKEKFFSYHVECE
jgi:hypothetical protein